MCPCNTRAGHLDAAAIVFAGGLGIGMASIAGSPARWHCLPAKPLPHLRNHAWIRLEKFAAEDWPAVASAPKNLPHTG